jgi:DUF971 family protein
LTHLIQIRLMDQTKLLLEWDDNSTSSIPLNKLRKFCPCATCMTDRENQNNSFIPIFHSGQTRISRINKIGNYAISITWEDGHNTGIYEFLFLKNLSDK